MAPHVLAGAVSSPPPAGTGFGGIAPGGGLIAVIGVAGLLVLGIVAALVSLRGPKRGVEGSRRAARGLGPDALEGAAAELRPSLAGVTARQGPDPVRLPRQAPAIPAHGAIPGEVRAWHEQRESR